MMLKNSLPEYKIFCLLIVLLNCFVVQGQNKYIKWIEKKNYEKAAEKLQSFIKKSEGDPIDLMNGYFALAYLSNQKDYEKFNVNDAYDYILKAYSNYDIASFENAKKLERDDITLEILNDYLNQICLNAYDYYCAKDNVKDYEYFLNYFQRMENNLKRNIILKRNSKAFMEAKMNDSEEAYNNFIVTYPDALDRSSAIDLRNKKGFEKAQELDKIESYQNFISKYPRAEQVKIAEERIHEIAFEQTKELNTNKDYLKYYNDYPNSKFAEKAFFLHQEREFFENTQQGSWKSYQNFREKYSDNPWRNVALDSIYQISKKSMHPRAMNYLFKEDNRFYILKNLKLYYQWISKDGELSTLEQFRLDFPQSYEQIDLFQYDLEVAKMAHELYLTSSFDNTNVSNTVNDDVTKRLQREGAKSGAVQVSLIWDNYNDLDLYCIDPLGEEISYNNKFSQSGGELDVDMNVNYGESLEPVENIYWSEGKVPTGEYRVYVKHFKNHYCGDNCEDPTFYNVRVKNGRNTKDYFGEIAHNDRVEVVRFNFKPAKFGDLEINSDNIARYEEYIKKAAPKELAFVALQRLISENLEKKRWKSALRVVNKFKSYFQGDKKIEQLEAMLSKEYDKSIAVVNLKSINTEGNEYYPIISANSKSLYFVGKDRSDNMGLEDIFKSNMINDKWTSAYIQTNLSSRESNEAISSLSADGNIAIYFKDGVLGAFQKTMDGWMEINYLPESINVGKWNGGAMISSDNNTIIFASNRESGFNYNKTNEYHMASNKYDLDLYAITKDEKGEWGEPINLGPSINTYYSERSPFLHPDMKTLYFSSDGHGGFGGYDVYKSTRTSEDCWDCWSEPINMGKEINTIYDDWGYKISTDGNTAYFAKKERGIDHSDLYSVNIPFYLRPDYVATISGRIEGLAQDAMQAEIVWEDLERQKEIGRTQTDPETGEYFIILPMGKVYGYYVDKQNFFPYASNIDLRKQTEPVDMSNDIKIISFDEMIQNQIPVPMSNLFFNTGSSRLLTLSYNELDRLAEIISLNNLKVEILGHTDNIGSEEINLELSQKRAENVKEYLINKGCLSHKIMTLGLGSSDPIASNDTEQGRKLNRRVTIRFIERD